MQRQRTAQRSAEERAQERRRKRPMLVARPCRAKRGGTRSRAMERSGCFAKRALRDAEDAFSKVLEIIQPQKASMARLPKMPREAAAVMVPGVGREDVMKEKELHQEK